LNLFKVDLQQRSAVLPEKPFTFLSEAWNYLTSQEKKTGFILQFYV